MDATLILLWLAAGLLVALGLAGLVLPVLPGPPLLFAGLFMAAWIEEFQYVGAGTLFALGAMAAIAYAVDIIASLSGAKRFGATRRGMIGAGIGALIGLFLGVLGIIIGPLLGAVIGELSARRDLIAAGRAGTGAVVGLIIGAAVKLALGLAMVGVFIVVRFL